MSHSIEENKIFQFIVGKKVFIKYVFIAGCSFVLDLIIFTIVSNLLKPFLQTVYILIATVVARIISSFFNYILNRNIVFSEEKKENMMDRVTLIKYYGLVVVQMLVSACLITLLVRLTTWNETLVKIPVDILIFICNYLIQKKFIFNKSN